MAGRIEQESVEEVLRRTDIVDLIGGYTQLVKRGNEFLGRCPFHDERTPSFWVNQTKGVYHCFGCSVSGDAIGFVREKMGLEFVEAIELLADRARVELRYDEASKDAKGQPQRRVNKTRLFELTDAAASFYQRYLADAEAAGHAREYLASRGVEDATVEAFRIGYSPDSPTGMSSRAAKRGFTGQELGDARLVGQKGSDFFRGRLMIPIVDRAARVVGFGARKLREEQFGGKYVNSADGPLFHKKATVYLPPDVRAAAQEAGETVVVEGYMDVIAMWQGGFRNAVAAMGTSLTDEQVTELKRLAPRAVFAFDPDVAGQAATLRALAKAREQDLDVRIVALPDGDPADVMALPDGAERMRVLLAGTESLMHYHVNVLLAGADLESATGRNEAFQRGLDLFGRMPAGTERSEQIQRFADQLRLDSRFIGRLEQASAPDVERGRNTPARTSRPAWRRGIPNGALTERQLLAAAWALSENGVLDAPSSGVVPEHFTLDEHRRVWAAIVSAGNNPVDISSVRSDSEVVGLVAELSALTERDHLDDVDTARDVLKELQVRLELRRVERAIADLKEALTGADEDAALLAQLRELESQRRAADPRLREGAPTKE